MSFDTPKTQAMRNFLKKERNRVVGLSIEPDGVFIYTNSSEWSDDAGAGTWRADSETAAIKDFYSTVQKTVRSNPMKRKKRTAKKKTTRRKNPAKTYYIIASLSKVSGGHSLRFYNGRGWGTVSKHAKYASQVDAKKIALGLDRTSVVAPATTTARKLLDVLQGKK